MSKKALLLRASFMVKGFISLAVFILLGTRTMAHPGSGIVVDKDGNVFFTDTGKGVWKIDKDGNLTYLPSSLFHWMAIDELGYFAKSAKSFGNWFERISPQNTRPVLITCSDFPFTVNRDGNIYYANSQHSPAGIIRRTPGGVESILASGEMFLNISGIAAGSDGSLYVTDASHSDENVIRKIMMDGTVSIFASGFVDKAGINNPLPETDVGYCRGLAVDSLGNVYVAATGSRSVLKITPQGKVSTILKTTGQWSPTGVALFKGELYMLEWNAPDVSLAEVRKAWIPRVRKVGLDGKIILLATVSR